MAFAARAQTIKIRLRPSSSIGMSDVPRPFKTIHGLSVDSTLDLRELADSDSALPPDILIRQGPVPKVWGEDPYVGGDADRLWLHIPGTLWMLIEGGSRITYQPATGVAEDALRLFILGSGLGALLIQRGFLVIHGNAVVQPSGEGAFLCVGPSGAGKSTTAVALMQRGLQVLADDVCPVDDDGLVHPGMARIKLWQEAATALGVDTAGLARIRAQDDKFNLPLGVAHARSAQRIHAVFCLEPADTDRVSVTQVSGMQRFVLLRQNLYRPEYLPVLGLEAGYLKRIAALAAATPIYRVSRPIKGFAIDALVNALLDKAEAGRHAFSIQS